MVKPANSTIASEQQTPPPARPRPKPFLVESELARHQRKCTICQHPERAAIEDEFLHWRSPASIGRIYKIKRRAVYRHAQALQLHKRRRRNLRYSLSRIMEQAHTVKVTPSLLIRGVHAFHSYQ
jgi:hypothetical protein